MVSNAQMENPQTDFYPELRDSITEKGLLDKQRTYYWFKICSTLGLLALSLTFLVVVSNVWFQLLNAAFLAFTFGQIGYLGHDAGHRAIFSSRRWNTIAGIGASSLMAVSRKWWITVHNQHHSTPNDLEQDPHTIFSMFAFSKEIAATKSRFWKFIIGYQAFYFVPVLLLEGLGMRLSSFQFLWERRRRERRVFVEQSAIILVHFAVYFGLLFFFLPWWQALVFFAVHQALFGLYYGTVFAPNHKGMLILEKENELDFLRTQVLTTRNVRPGLLTDFWYGGLNYQIEHHLFPLMPRNNLGKARKIIKDFCQKHGISYYETGTLRSYKEILCYMHEIVEPIRRLPWSPKKAELST